MLVKEIEKLIDCWGLYSCYLRDEILPLAKRQDELLQEAIELIKNSRRGFSNIYGDSKNNIDNFLAKIKK